MARPRTFDEETVVAAARDAFWSRGYAATSVDDLTEATGLGKSSLYGAFGDKRALFLRALDDHSMCAIDNVQAQLRQPGVAAYDRLAGHIRAMVAEMVADTHRRGCLIAKSSAELGASDDDVDRIVGRWLDSWREALADCIDEARRDGDVAPGVDPQAAATLLLGLIRGFESLRKGGIKPGQISAAADQALALISR